MSPIKKCLIKVFSDSIVLEYVESCDFMLDPVLFKVVFDVASYVLASPIRVEYLNLLASFQFCL